MSEIHDDYDSYMPSNPPAPKTKKTRGAGFYFGIAVIIAVVIIAAVILIPIFVKIARKNEIVRSITPQLEQALENAKKASGLSDLSYRVQIDEFNVSANRSGKGKTYFVKEGDIILLSDEIEQYEPDEMYKTMQKTSEAFFGSLHGDNFYKIKTDKVDFYWLHGPKASHWKTSTGTQYYASYYHLEKNGKEIYDNPTNDLEWDMTHPQPSGSSSAASTKQTCKTAGCKNEALSQGDYCKDHTCTVTGCYNERYKGESICGWHVYLRDYANKDYHDVDQYNDPDDFYEDWFDDFEDYDEAEQYWDEHHK